MKSTYYLPIGTLKEARQEEKKKIINFFSVVHNLTETNFFQQLNFLLQRRKKCTYLNSMRINLYFLTKISVQFLLLFKFMVC